MPFVVALTGSTGNLGSYMLNELLQNPYVSRIVCLNRSVDARRKQIAALEVRDLITDLPSDRVEFITVDYAAERLGIKDDDYQRLTEDVSVLIHNAWPVDFNRKLSSFSPSLDGVDTLIKLSLAHQQGPRMKILFVSSMGAASNWASYAPTSRDHIPEAELTEWKLARTGYGQSKLLAERIFTQASRTWDLPISIVRIGQLAGPVEHGLKGSWPRHEWVPSIIESSLILGAIPQDLGPNEAVDWIPVDLAARTLVELTMDLEARTSLPASRPDQGARFYHVSNPHLISWADMIPTIKRFLPRELRDVSFIEWVDLLKDTRDAAGEDGAEGSEDSSNIPAVRLWDTYRYMQDRAIRFPGSQLITLETKQTRKCSATLASLPPVGKLWMELWMRQWKLGQDTA